MHIVARRARLVVAALAALTFTGCGCDLVGCIDGLRVRLATLPSGPFTVELLVNGDVQEAPATATCTTAGECFQDHYFRVTPAQGTVRVTTPNGTRVTTFERLQYDRQRPNGRGCDPVCRVATVTANIP